MAIIFSCASVIYLAAWFLQYENNILIFVANVFAPAALIVLLVVAALADAYARIAGRRPSPNELLVRYIMIVAVLIPTVMGEVRSGVFASHRAAASAGKHLSVLDANLLGTVEIEEAFYEALDRLSPDIVLLQELNPPVAQKILERVGSRYACQALQPQVGTYGMGVLAKFPCTATPGPQEVGGFGLPQFIDLQLDTHQQVRVINFHTIPPHTLIRNREQDNELQRLSNSIIEREKFMRSIIVEAQKLPTDGIILGGDLNATVRNRVYGIIRKLGLCDAWSVGDRLLGGTWPGPHYPLPSWLIRIDYIFHSDTLVAKTAETLPNGFGSDHRGVFATFDLLPTPNSKGSDTVS
jgi:endonuclease/exonuclease/phosphatase (EEP) superfamily protein YafD